MIETAELPLLQVLGHEVAEIFADLHRDHGVDLRLGVQVDEITGDERPGRRRRLADGSRIRADVSSSGWASRPTSQLAVEAGLDVDNGIVVDAGLHTPTPTSSRPGTSPTPSTPGSAQHLRVEHWANALHQPQTAARSMLGQDVGYDRVPYFYTDQYDLGMEYSGYVEPGGYDQVVFRGDVPGREFIAFWLGGGRVLAGMNVNVWDVNDKIEALVGSGRAVGADRLADLGVPLEELVAGEG